MSGVSSWLAVDEEARPAEYGLWQRGSPTGWYQHSKTSGWSFWRWWRRSLPRHIGLELLVYLVLYYVIHLLYRAVLTDEQKTEFEEIVTYFNEKLSPLARDLAFLLGFYVKMIVTRWWNQFKQLPWPDSLALQVQGLVMFETEEAMEYSHRFMRYLILSYVLCLRRISKVIRETFPSHSSLMAARLATLEELEVMEKEGELDMVWWIPLCWCMSMTKNARHKQKIIPSDHKEILRGVVKFKEGLESVEGHDHIQVPPVYKQVVDVAIYFYFALSLIGNQELESHPEMFFPIFLVLKFIFFIGWLKVAEAIAHPFGHDEDDFQIGELISRHIWATGKLLSQCGGPPAPPNKKKVEEETNLENNHVESL